MLVKEIDELVRKYQIDNGLRPRPSPFFSGLDESEMEVVWLYEDRLKAIGVDFSNGHLQDAFIGNPHHIEDAILALLEYRDKFKDKYHPTNFLAKALIEGWKPIKKRNQND